MRALGLFWAIFGGGGSKMPQGGGSFGTLQGGSPPSDPPPVPIYGFDPYQEVLKRAYFWF